MLRPSSYHGLLALAVRRLPRLTADVSLSHSFAALTNLIGTSRVHITAYHTTANETGEILHLQLKASPTAHASRAHWASNLTYVLLAIRSAFRSVFKCTSKELAYGTILRVPEDYAPVSPGMIASPSDYVHSMHEFFNQVRPAPPRTATARTIFVSDNLGTFTHVFVCQDMVKMPYSTE